MPDFRNTYMTRYIMNLRIIKSTGTQILYLHMKTPQIFKLQNI